MQTRNLETLGTMWRGCLFKGGGARKYRPKTDLVLSTVSTSRQVEPLSLMVDLSSVWHQSPDHILVILSFDSVIR